MNTKEIVDLSERAEYAGSILDVLLAAMQSDNPPAGKSVQDVIHAVRLMLE